MVPTPAAGPGYFGSGASAYIQGKKSKWLYKIPHDAAYSSLEYTISFQVFLLSVPGETFATILAKVRTLHLPIGARLERLSCLIAGLQGTDKTFGPSIFVDSTTKRLRVKIRYCCLCSCSSSFCTLAECARLLTLAIVARSCGRVFTARVPTAPLSQ